MDKTEIPIDDNLEAIQDYWANIMSGKDLEGYEDWLTDMEAKDEDSI